MELAIIQGVLGKDPTYGRTPKGVEYAEFSVGVNKNNGETSWYSVKVWDRLVNAARKLNLKKGNRVMVFGDLDVSVYNDKAIKAINCCKLDLIYASQKQPQQPNGNYQRQTPTGYDDNIQQQVMNNVQTQQIMGNLVDDDDLPF